MIQQYKLWYTITGIRKAKVQYVYDKAQQAAHPDVVKPKITWKYQHFKINGMSKGCHLSTLILGHTGKQRINGNYGDCKINKIIRVGAYK